MLELLKQDLNVGYEAKLQASLIFIGQSGLLDDISKQDLHELKLLLLERIPQTVWYQKLDENKALDEATKQSIVKSIKPLIQEYVKGTRAKKTD